jgi:chemotaxis protein methyltransferase CheR
VTISASYTTSRDSIWSAGCSSGQEPFSLAMTILSEAPDLAKQNVKILATDIDPVILDRAKAGVYPADEIDHLPRTMRTKLMIIEGGGQGSFRVAPQVRDLVTFGILNLIDDLPMSGPFDVIFCRNVAIYFDKATQERTWKRFADLLDHGGHLYIGHSERISGPATAQIKSCGITIYRKTATERRDMPPTGKPVK